MPYPNPLSTEKTTRIVSDLASQAARLGAGSVELAVAINTQHDQIFVCVVTQEALFE